VPDLERPLAKRGRRDAPRIGAWLRSAGYVPDLVVCSAARRAQQTWELVAPEVDGTPEVRIERRVYEATVLALLMLVRELPEARRTVLIVGHNPGLAELAVGLADRPDNVGLTFPTAAVAVLGMAGDWADAAPGAARLLDFVTPSSLP
jgi:phosphohistidine phosphatase